MMNLHIFKAKCPVCPKTVFHVAEPGTKKVEYFEVPETKMLVIVATPEVDGVKRIALGPCQRKEPFYHEGKEEPVVYFAHVRHACQPLPPTPMAGNMDTSSSSTINAGSSSPSIAPAPEAISFPVPSVPISK
jgi:hypothetical protein